MLPSFEVENFRTFSDLRIGHLGGVNLVVGRNNVGKTMLLEALRLYACGGAPIAVLNLLYDRDEFFPGRRSEGRLPNVLAQSFSSLFFERSAERAAVLQSGMDDPAAVRIEAGFFRRGVRQESVPSRLSHFLKANQRTVCFRSK